VALFSGGFNRSPSSIVEPEGDTALLTRDADGRRSVIDVAALAWVGFLFVGDEFSPVYEGWWLFGRADSAIAIWIDCPRVDSLMRQPPLATIADALPSIRRIDVASRPADLRGGRSRTGIVHLDALAVERLHANGVVRDVATVTDFPTIL